MKGAPVCTDALSRTGLRETANAFIRGNCGHLAWMDGEPEFAVCAAMTQ